MDNNVQVKVLGYGGAFATTEDRNSSFFVTDKQSEKNLLIDCGSLVFATLLEQELADKIDVVYITHMHEDHVGSLSSLIYYHHFVLHNRIKIVCAQEIQADLEIHLTRTCQHEYEQFEVITYYDELMQDNFPSFDFDIFSTAGKHFTYMESTGCVLKLKNREENIYFSGDIGIPLVDYLGLEVGKHYIFQDAGIWDFREISTNGEIPHAYYLDCDHENTYLYHHTKSDAIKINNELENATSVYSIYRQMGTFVF